MNRMLGYNLSRILNKVITSLNINENLKLQMICTSNDVCITLAENNISLLNRIDKLEKKIFRLEECLDNKNLEKSLVIVNDKPKSLIVIDYRK